jgi:hypothetical protein
MRKNVNITTAPTEIVSADKNTGWLILQNQSDTTIFLDFSGLNSEGDLTTANGIQLVAGQQVALTGGIANNSVRGIHGGTGNKVIHVQGGANK